MESRGVITEAMRVAAAERILIGAIRECLGEEDGMLRAADAPHVPPRTRDRLEGAVAEWGGYLQANPVTVLTVS